MSKIDQIIIDYIGSDNFKCKWNPPNLYRDRTAQQYATDLADFIKKYSFLFQIRSLDFFVLDVWSKLIPEEWRDPLLSMTDTDAMQFHKGTVVLDTFPQSLKEFIHQAVSLWMPTGVHRADESQWSLHSFSLETLFIGMSEKKIHEIKRMAEIVHSVAQVLQPTEMLDIGSGEGYLTQVLSHQFKYSISAVDCSHSFIQGAMKRQSLIEDQRISKELKEKNIDKTTITNTTTTNNITANQRKELKSNEKKVLMKELNITSPNMCVATIHPDMKGDDFIDLLNNNNSSKNYESMMLLGLHTCGNLPATMIQNFIGCNHIDSIIDVGCCYYKVDGNHVFLSEHCKSLDLVLGPAPLKLSCEATEKSQADQESFEYSNRVHFYRVILETWLKKQVFNNRNHDFTIRNLSKTHCATFESYAKASIARINRLQQQQDSNAVHPDITLDSLMEFYKENNFNTDERQKQVSIFLLLRGLLSPVIESLIVLDRWLYLNQFSTTCNSFITPIFDKNLSPRNFIIISYKYPIVSRKDDKDDSIVNQDIKK
ncbi:hypothetical protein CYY_000820 [Polysphondylium violaceum]|uniref:Methyltransferase domain-containing protein n=1 Tax=Polysphondylium violaceum TaxID=133409 RepID=A0A8J4Q0T1_9MYCE|nr:hypothetical protein CYY_000820 [Polysphondylium violaceum]